MEAVKCNLKKYRQRKELTQEQLGEQVMYYKQPISNVTIIFYTND